MSHETLGFVVSGSKAELEGFLRSLDVVPELQLVSSEFVQRSPGPAEEEPFGNVQLVDLVVNFAISVSASATYDLVAGHFDRYKGKHRRLKMRKSDGSSKVL